MSTKIMATLGPTLCEVKHIVKLASENVDMYRVHMGLRQRDFCSYFMNVRLAQEKIGKKLEVILDLPSSRMRVGDMKEIKYQIGDKVRIEDRISSYDNKCIPMPHLSQFIPSLNKGERITFRDGQVVFEIKNINSGYILCECIQAETTIKKMSASLFPDSRIVYDSLEDEDIFYLKIMCKLGLIPEWIAVSFVEQDYQIEEVRNICSEVWGNNNIKLMAKIESKNGIKNLDNIMKWVEGIMVARGDLMSSITPYELPDLQNIIVKKCNAEGLVSCVATGIFTQFANSKFCSKAEIADLYLIIKEQADYIMLSQETGNSKYPFECVEMINRAKDYFESRFNSYYD